MNLPTLSISRGDKDAALDAALTHLVPRGLAASTLVSTESAPDAIAASGIVDADVHVTAVRRVPATPAEYAPWPDGTHPEVVGAYARRGIEQVYSHQAEAIRCALDGQDVVIVTPTASGKTLCYNAPVLSAIAADGASRALYLFPTKALAQDQLAELHAVSASIADATGSTIGVFTYDGDTPQDARRAIRQQAHVVLSNPDMLHAGVLPHHPKWAKLFENLRYIVIDELHAYRGVFGSHLANILRRLQRVCRHYGSNPTFICCSATIANPRELANGLTERSCVLVDRNGAPRGEKFFLFVNPPVVNEALGIRRSYLAETRRVALEFLKRSLQVIVFAQSRLATELLTTYLKDACEGPPGSGSDETVRGYRGGYLPLRRREIERGLREGTVRAVVSTSALELGIDIGALDVSVLAGYPGTIAGTWQRAGRAGRRSTRSATVLVASSAPLDQYVVRHPAYFFDASPEHALISPDNLHILLDHLKCAAFELPFTAQEPYGGRAVDDILQVLADERFVHFSDQQWHWMHESYPADAVSLRSISSDNFVVVDTTRTPRVIAETDYNSAFTMLHEKAIYILEGQLYHVERLDVDQRKAFVREVECDYYTDAITYTRVSILDEFARGCGADASRPSDAPLEIDADGSLPRGLEPAHDVIALLDGSSGHDGAAYEGLATRSHGEVHVVSRVIGFKKIKFYTNENVGAGDLDLPEHQMHTTAYWLTIPPSLIEALPFSTDDRRDGIAGVAHALHSIAQLQVMCDRSDLGVSVDNGILEPGGVSTSAARDHEPRIFIYDNYPGGIGFSAPLFDMHGALLQGTRELIRTCPCDHGCPSCVGPAGDVGPHAKMVALALLDHLMGGGSSAEDEVPF